MLVTGSMTARFAKKQEIMRRIADSFQIVAAPTSSLNKANAYKAALPCVSIYKTG